MRICRRALFPLALCVATALPPSLGATPAGAAPAPCPPSVPYRSGTAGYHTFRIPAALQVPGGALLAFAEGRRDSAADDGNIDLVLRRSLDGGCTWQPLQVVADAGADTVGNPVPVVDPRSGDVVLLSCRTLGGATERQVRSGAVPAYVRRVFLQRSTDGGASWSPQRDITDTVKPGDWRWYATGPGHGVALRHGHRRGRLLAPANHSSAVTGKGGAHALYSDDGGLSWRIGYRSGVPDEALALSETTLAELPGGRIYVNARAHDAVSGSNRAAAYSGDGGLTLSSAFRPQPQLTGPVVQASVLQSGTAGTGPLLYSGPADPVGRRRMRVWASRDGGASWRPLWTVSDAPAGYSDLVRFRAGGGTGGTSRTGLLYETGARTYSDTIAFVPLPLPLRLPGPAPAP